MVNMTSNFLAGIQPGWWLFNHTIILNNKENTKFLDF